MRTLGLLVICCASATAHAEEQLAINGHLGVATPVGFIGAAAEVTPIEWLSFEAGVGKGLAGLQFALHPRVRVADLNARPIALGVGVSAGRYERRDPWYGIEYLGTKFDTAVWTNIDIAIENSATSNLHMRFYLGAAILAHGSITSCSDLDGPRTDCGMSDRGTILPYLGLSLGYGLL